LEPTRRNDRRTQRYLTGALVIFTLLLAACATPTVGPTPTPTRTPKPPTPTATLTPSPTPTPAFPVTAGCAPAVPAAGCERFKLDAMAQPETFAWTDQPDAVVQLSTTSSSDAHPAGTWTYAVAAPFFTIQDAVSSTHLMQTWSGTPTGAFVERPLLVTTDTVRALVATLGPPNGAQIQTVARDALLATAEQTGAWAILPFDQLEPHWKVLRIDGQLPTSKDWDAAQYPLTVPLYLSTASRPDALARLSLGAEAYVNRDPEALTIVAMTGVTAITRGTARLIERTSVTYPAQDVKPWFADADIVHVSNEVSFKPDCPAAPSGTMSFCSHDRYIGLLEEIGTNVIELTGNHLGDKGYQWITHSLEMYRERGWEWYGGGADLADATRPLTMTHNGNRIAFLGCNSSRAGVFASETRPGAALCYTPEQHALMLEQVRALREQGYLPIVTLQQTETDQYVPPHEHLRDLRMYAEAGAIIAHGSQAHWVKPMEFHGDTFIHYGPGNFFFDQMWDVAVRQEFIMRYTFYEGRLLSIELKTALLEEYGRPRPMTAEERAAFLTTIFELSPDTE
jgi:poly-gamma-glutamate capsule biosynthesis protein CapA/YwtB (metallophosphatase superfamily)